LVCSSATPDEDKMQNYKKFQKRTKFDFGVSWFARRPPRMKTKCKTSKSLKIVQSSFLGFLGLLAGHPGSRQNAKLQKGSKSYKVRFWGFLVCFTATPDQDKMQNFKKAQKRTKFVLGFLGSLAGHPG
jgi:hypothetical protein